MRFVSEVFALLLTPLLAVSPLLAQSSSISAPAVNLAPELVLKLRVVETNTAARTIASPPPTALNVQVTDGSEAGVPNAAVVFRFPESGPSGKFGDGTKVAVVYTDTSGLAHIQGLQWDNGTGSVALRITAAKNTGHAGLLYEQQLSASQPSALPRSLPVTSASAKLSPAAGASAPSLTTVPGNVPGTLKPASNFGTHVSVISASRSRRAHSAPEETDNDSDEAPVEARKNEAPKNEAPAALADDSLDANVPVRHFASSGASDALEESSSVSVTSAGPASHSHSKAKWLIAIGVAAGAGTALALMHRGGSSSSASGISIGAPSISVGHP